MNKAPFYIHVRVEHDSRWVRWQWTHSLAYAVKSATEARDARVSDVGGAARVFRGVRIQYRGMTLQRWNGGRLA